jgi:poly(U)-specific endoribonuclease
VHNDPYGKQPAQNPHITNTPYVPSGGYGPGGIPAAPHGVSLPTGFNNGHATNSAPYPTHLPNHPHPNPSIGSSSFPSHPSPPHNGAPSFPQTYPQTHTSYPQTHTSYPQSHSQYPVHGAPPPYHPPQYAPSYHSPPPTAPFVPGRTVIVMPESTRHSSGPGIGSVIAGGVAGGIAAGATNAIVDHAISSIFRSSPNHVHTYPSAPPVGTPTTVTHTTNNYYYGPDGNGNSGNAGGNSGGVAQPQGGAQPQYTPSGTPQNTAQAPAQSGSTAMGTPGNPGIVNSATSGTPSGTTNGAVSRTPDGQPEVPPPSNVISDEDLMKFTEELFDKYENNLYQYVDLNLQKRVNSPPEGAKVPDEAPEPLFNLKSDLYNVPTVSTLRALYDNYEHDGTQKESVTESKRNEVTAFIDEVVKTPVMSRALAWLVERKYVEPDGYEQKDLLRRMWFTNFDETSSGFERIFLSEKFGDSGIVGMQNWIYFANREAQNKANYLGYTDMINLSGKGSLLKLNYESEGFTIQNATIFVGTPPELEMALYTVCFHARPNNWCPISIGGAKFFILTHSFRYFGKDLIDLGFPAF